MSCSSWALCFSAVVCKYTILPPRKNIRYSCLNLNRISGDPIFSRLGLDAESWSSGRANLESALGKLDTVQDRAALLRILFNCGAGADCRSPHTVLAGYP